MVDKVKITIDGTVHEVTVGENVLQVCVDRGLLVPHFCYHKALGAVGSCRLCAAMIAPAKNKPARLEMTCMTRAADGMVITVNDPYAKDFRRGVIEYLMLNHPHDCPVCDEGGECMLQDMTVISEHSHRRTRVAKRTWKNQDLGPLIHHEMNRCITCYRCVRYYREYALGDDLGVFGSRDRVYFGRVRDGVLESEFAGNLVDVCPTGVFTNKRFREVYNRPWDLSTTRSVCLNCSVGCNLLPGFRHGLLRRIKPAENPAVNRFFICDRGRYGAEYVNSPARLRAARIDGVQVSAEDAVTSLAARLKDIVSRFGPDAVAAIGSHRSSLEANGALAIAMKSLGSSRIAFFESAGEREAIRRATVVSTSGLVLVPTLPEIEECDFVLSVGGDLTGEAPMIDLAVRQAIRAGAASFVLSPRAGKLDALATLAHRCQPGTEALLLGRIQPGDESPALTENAGDFAADVSAALANATTPLILCSTLHDDPAVVDAAFALALRASRSDRPCRLAYYFPGANSAGIGMALHDEAPESIWDDVEDGKIKALLILERNAAAEFDTAADFTDAIQGCELVAAIDCFENPTTTASSIVIPCVSHYQAFGTLVNFEGRAQRFSGLPIPDPVSHASSEILLNLLAALGGSELISGSEFHDVYAVTPESSQAIDALKAGEEGVRVRGTSPPPKPNLAPARHDVSGLVEWEIIHTFGSEEISALSPPVQELAPSSVVELHPDEAKARNLSGGGEVDFGEEIGVKGILRLNPGIAMGTVGVTVLRTEAVGAATCKEAQT